MIFPPPKSCIGWSPGCRADNGSKFPLYGRNYSTKKKVKLKTMRKTKKRMDFCENALGEAESIYLIRYLPPALEMTDVLATAETVLM